MPHLERVQRAKAAEQEQARVLETFGAVSQTFLAQRQETLRPRSFIETKRYIEKHWASLHRVSIQDITQRDVGRDPPRLRRWRQRPAGLKAATKSAPRFLAELT
jgi:hypothetical protein